eukprot:6685412-Alexandrium_andersonii.AAC.1
MCVIVGAQAVADGRHTHTHLEFGCSGGIQDGVDDHAHTSGMRMLCGWIQDGVGDHAHISGT